MTPKPRQNAYLVLRQGGKWTDVLRLTSGETTVIGRSNQAQIVIRSEQCSRAHAEIVAQEGGWTIRDLGSRNGTLLDGVPLQGASPFAFGQTITIAGCQMTLVRHATDAFSPSAGDEKPTVQGKRLASDEDPSKTMDATELGVITARKRKTSYLEALPNHGDSPPTAALFRTAFELARCATPEQAAAIALATLRESTGVSSGAVLVLRNPGASEAPQRWTTGAVKALATTSREGRSYRGPAEKLSAAVIEGGEAILARNIADDLSIAGPDSRGQFSTSSTLCAPISIAGSTIGLLHLYSSEEEDELQVADLEFALAVAANLGLALEQLWRQDRLSSNLRRSQQQLAQLRQQLGQRVKIIGSSRAMQEIEAQVARVAPTNTTVLIRGESGVGKELIAAALHHCSPRRDGPFVCLNCAALSPNLLESELFGHEKGAFTGATERKIGKFEAADGGTLMLDEIGEMNPEIQAKFLRVLEGQPFERVGGNVPIAADVRVIAATNRDLEAAVRGGLFRSDLFFRLHVVELHVPPLRQRGEDVLLLATHFLAQFSADVGRRFDGFSQAARKKLLDYSWPGNVRELKNTLERAVVLSPGPRIEADDLMLSHLHLPPALTPSPAVASQGWSPKEVLPGEDAEPLSLAELERQHIERVLERTRGNKSQAAKLLGIERSTLDRKLKRLDT